MSINGTTQPIPLPILFGTGTFGHNDPTPSIKIRSPSQLQPLLNIFRSHGHTQIDTSRIYPSFGIQGGSETLIGHTDFSHWATIDTKVTSSPGSHTPSNIAASIATSLHELGVTKLQTIYLHYPDRTVPLSLTIPAIASAVSKGQASRWAISNYTVSEVRTIIAICKEQALPLPHCYQGHYNALARKAEDALLPLLREHGIAFYAYSPTAGGAFSAQSSRMADDSHIGAIMRGFYGSESTQRAIEKVREMAKAQGLSGHEVACRWVRYHSALDAGRGDAMVVGASSEAQLEETLSGLERGPLERGLAEAVTELWEVKGVREGAPEYTPFMENGDVMGDAGKN